MDSSPRTLSPPPKRRIGGEGGDGLPGASPPAGDPDGANRTAAHDPWELRRPCHPAVPGAAWRICPSPPEPQPSRPAPCLQSCTSRARRARTQNPSREQSIVSRRSASAEGQRAEADTPTRLSPLPDPGSRAGDPRLSCPNKSWRSPAHSVFSGSRSLRTLGSTPLRCFLNRRSLGWSGSPWRLHGCCANTIRLNRPPSLHPRDIACSEPPGD